MKGLCFAAAACLLAAPALAQDNPVKAGVEAWERGDYPAAVQKWRRPANAGDADAQFNLGQAYKLGRGVPLDLAQAEYWYGKAAALGHEQAEANYGLALFSNGKRAESVVWLQRAVRRGDPRAQYIYGTMLFNGDGVAKDWVTAYALVVRAAGSGLSQASAAQAEMDRYIPTGDRQKGLALARRLEIDSAAALPPVIVASAPPSRPSAAASTPTPRASAPASRPPAAASPGVASAVPATGAWRLQLGAFGDPANARKLWGQVGTRFPGRQVAYVKQGNLTRVLVGPYASRSQASAGCAGVSPCVPVSN